MVATVIRTAFVQEIADRLRDRFPKLSSLMDEAEADVLAFRPRSGI
jgi:hypothetical protein